MACRLGTAPGAAKVRQQAARAPVRLILDAHEWLEQATDPVAGNEGRVGGRFRQTHSPSAVTSGR